MEIASSPTSSVSSDDTGGGTVLSRKQLNKAMSNVVEYFQSGNTDKFNVTLNLKELDVCTITHCYFCTLNTLV